MGVALPDMVGLRSKANQKISSFGSPVCQIEDD